MFHKVLKIWKENKLLARLTPQTITQVLGTVPKSFQTHFIFHFFSSAVSIKIPKEHHGRQSVGCLWKTREHFILWQPLFPLSQRSWWCQENREWHESVKVGKCGEWQPIWTYGANARSAACFYIATHIVKTAKSICPNPFLFWIECINFFGW